MVDFLWQYLLNVVADNCFEIAIDKSGCCVLQLCVDNSRGEARDRLISEITASALLLAEDPYGFVLVLNLIHILVCIRMVSLYFYFSSFQQLCSTAYIGIEVSADHSKSS